MTYLLLNAIVLVLALLLLRVRQINKPQIITLAILLVMTTIFDSIIIALDIVNYDVSKTLQVTIGIVPIEDYFYTIFAVLILPMLWKRLGKGQDAGR